MGFGLPIDFAIAMGLGWIWYLARTLPQVNVAWPGVATAGICLVLFLGGSHLFLGWLYQGIRSFSSEAAAQSQRKWNWRWTGSLAAVIVLMFVAGMSVTGIAHQVGWLLTSKEALGGF